MPRLTPESNPCWEFNIRHHQEFQKIFKNKEIPFKFPYLQTPCCCCRGNTHCNLPLCIPIPVPIPTAAAAAASVAAAVAAVGTTAAAPAAAAATAADLVLIPVPVAISQVRPATAFRAEDICVARDAGAVAANGRGRDLGVTGTGIRAISGEAAAGRGQRVGGAVVGVTGAPVSHIAVVLVGGKVIATSGVIEPGLTSDGAEAETEAVVELASGAAHGADTGVFGRKVVSAGFAVHLSISGNIFDSQP